MMYKCVELRFAEEEKEIVSYLVLGEEQFQIARLNICLLIGKGAVEKYRSLICGLVSEHLEWLVEENKEDKLQ